MSKSSAGVFPVAAAALASVSLGAVLLSSHACAGRAPALKHVIFFIGDGMSAQSEVAASRYLTGRDDGLAWHKFPGQSYVATWDVKVYNGNARRARRPPYSRTAFTPLLGYDVKEEGPRPRSGEDGEPPFPPGPATDSASAAMATERLGQYLSQPAPRKSYVIQVGRKALKPTAVLLGDPIEADSRGHAKDIPVALLAAELLARIGAVGISASAQRVLARLWSECDAAGVWQPRKLSSAPKSLNPATYHFYPLHPDPKSPDGRVADVTFRLALIAKLTGRPFEYT